MINNDFNPNHVVNYTPWSRSYSCTR